ncbi:MAG TPA: signal peptidase II [Rhizomicrobium sp.]
MSPRDLGLACAAAALAVDQASKLVLLYGLHFIEMAPGDHIGVLPFFDLVMVWNPGISYGLLPAHGLAGTAVLAVFSLAAVIGLGWWLWRAERKLLSAALGLVIGGAIGNLIDRLIYGRVADFFHFYVGGYDWYVFNVADCAITLGVAALLYDALVRPSAEAESRQSRRSE